MSNEAPEEIPKGNKPSLNDLKSILDYYKWEQEKGKINEKKENLYALDKKMIDEWKSKIHYEELKEELNKKGKECKEEDVKKFYENKKIKLDDISLAEIDIGLVIKNPNECQKDNTEKNYKNPVLKEEEIELVNNEINDFFRQFHKDNWGIEVDYQNQIKDDNEEKVENEDKNKIKTNEKEKEAKKKEGEKVEEKKEEKNKVDDKVEENKVEDKKEEDKTAEEKKEKDKKEEDKKEEDKTVEGKKEEDKKVEDKKEEDKTVEEKKEKDKTVEDKKEEDKKVEEKSNLDNKDNQNIINEISTDNNNINTNNLNQNNNNNINNNNNLEQQNKAIQDFQMKFQMIMKYLQENGGENNFINSYFNFSRLEPKNDKEKEIIEYLRTKMDNYQPNIINGLVILNTQIPSLGLQNVGATCYMNSTLQCLIHIKELSEILLSAFFLKSDIAPFNDKDFIERHILTLEYVNILKQVFFPRFYGSDMKCFAPYKFKEIVGNLNPLFSGICANDAKDLLQFILERMHSELKMATCYFQEYYIDQTNEEEAQKYFFNSYVSQSCSPLLSILYGIIKIVTRCLKCNTVKYNFQSYNLLYFPLKEAKRNIIEVKKKEDAKFDEKKYVLKLEDCFVYNEKYVL